MADKKSGIPEVTEEQYNGAVFQDGGSLVVNLANIEALKFELIPKGIYNATIDECVYGMSQSSNAPMMTFTCEISDGNFQGRKLPFYASFSRKALPGTKANLMRLDPSLGEAAFDPEKLANSGNLIGRPIRIRIAVEDYQGEDRSRIAGFLPAIQNGAAGAPQAAAGGQAAGGFVS